MTKSMRYLSDIDQELQELVCTTPILIYKNQSHLLEMKKTEIKQTEHTLRYQESLEKHVQELVNEDAINVTARKNKISRGRLDLTQEQRDTRVREQNRLRKQNERKNKRELLTQAVYEQTNN